MAPLEQQEQQACCGGQGGQLPSNGVGDTLVDLGSVLLEGDSQDCCGLSGVSLGGVASSKAEVIGVPHSRNRLEIKTLQVLGSNSTARVTGGCGCNPALDGLLSNLDGQKVAGVDRVNGTEPDVVPAKRIDHNDSVAEDLQLRTRKDQPNQQSCCGGESKVLEAQSELTPDERLDGQKAQNEPGCCGQQPIGNRSENLRLGHSISLAQPARENGSSK